MPARWMAHAEYPGRRKVVFEVRQFVDEPVVSREREVLRFENALEILIEILLRLRRERYGPDIREILRRVVDDARAQPVLIDENVRVAMLPIESFDPLYNVGNRLGRERTSNPLPYSSIET